VKRTAQVVPAAVSFQCAGVGRAVRKSLSSLGGSTRVVAPDNLREAVLSADIYDPDLNPLYRDVPA